MVADTDESRWGDGQRKKVSNIVYSARWYLPSTCSVRADALHVWSTAVMVNAAGVVDTARIRKEEQNKKNLQCPWIRGGTSSRWWWVTR